MQLWPGAKHSTYNAMFSQEPLAREDFIFFITFFVIKVKSLKNKESEWSILTN